MVDEAFGAFSPWCTSLCHKLSCLGCCLAHLQTLSKCAKIEHNELPCMTSCGWMMTNNVMVVYCFVLSQSTLVQIKFVWGFLRRFEHKSKKKPKREYFYDARHIPLSKCFVIVWPLVFCSNLLWQSRKVVKKN